MNVIESTPNAIDLIAEEFVERFRKGERPAVSEYEARFPEQAEAIRDLFPALLVLENLKPATAPVPTTGQAECASEVASLGKLGDYRIVREIGRGGMGIVYEAVQESLGRQVALKVLPKQLMGDSSRQARFEREARAAARLHHTNIVPVFGVGAENGLHYYAMQYIHGLGLDEVLRELKRLKSPSQDQPATNENGERPADEPQRRAVSVTVTQALLKGQFDNNATEAAPPPLTQRASEGNDTAKARLSDTARLSESFTLPGLQESGPGTGRNTKTLWQSIARIGTQVGAALHYAHEQAVLHRDIKPSNLLLDTRGTVWVTDFGLAKADDQRDLTNTGDVLGTLRYMAPEMFSGQADRRSDVYSLGLTLYELLALRPAFDESDRGRLIRLVLHESPPRLRTLDPSIPRDLETIIHKAIDREPSHRYPSAQDLADDLQRYLNDEPIRARRISPITRFNRWCKRNPAVAGLTSAIAILLLVATGVSLAAAMTFQQMASRNSKLAGDLKTALGDAQKNLAQVKEKEELAQTNLGLATTEQQRAEGNLDLALKAMDAVYLEAIGTEKLLGEPVARREGEASPPRPRAPLSDLEKQLLQRGLNFYDQFAQQNAKTPRAAVQTAQAHYRVGLLQTGLGDNSAAAAAYRAAIERFQKLTKEEPNNAAHWRQLGETLQSLAVVVEVWETAKKHLLGAADAYTRAIQIDAKSGHLYWDRAKIHVLLGDGAAIAKDIRQASRLLKTDHAFQVWAAENYISDDPRVRDEGEARKSAERAVNLRPDAPESFLALSKTYGRGDPKQLELLSQAIRLNAKYVHALGLRAEFFRESGNAAAALADIDAALTVAPDDPWTLAKSARVRLHLTQFGSAQKHIERSLELSPHVSMTWAIKSELHLAKKEFAKAIESADQAIALCPNTSWIYKRKAEGHWGLGQYKETLEALRMAWTNNPRDLSTLIWISPSLVAKCRNEEFKVGVLKLADEAVTKDPAARNHRAVIAMHLGQWDKAREDMAELMKAGSANYTSHYNLAMLSLADKNQVKYRSASRAMLAKFAESKVAEELNFTVWTAALAPQALDDYGPAIALAQRGVELNKENPEAIRSLGAILYRAGKFDEAAQQLAPLAAAAEKSSPAAKTSSSYPLVFLAMAQHRLGKKDESRATLQKAAELAKAELSDDKNPPPWNRKLTLELLQKEAEVLIGN